MSNLRELITNVRVAKTAAEEREIITKECAVIRSTMSSNNLTTRHRNVAKLIYIQLLGYPTQYGQMECLALISSHHYSDKRIGYLALMLLLDETQEVLTLVTNHLHNDLLSKNQFIVGLSLSTISNIGSVGIAQDVASEKKACAAALRIIRKCPTYSEMYIQKTKAMLVERQLSLQLAGNILAIEICKYHPQAIPEFRKLIPSLTNNLKMILNSSFMPDFDVSGINHPFLQSKIIQLLGILGHGDKANSSLMYSVLSFVMANTSSSRNVGNSVLLETVKTIIRIEPDDKLLQSSINVLIKLLNGKDSNYKYVALETLQYLLDIGASTIQKNKGVIVDYLVYSLVNESNVVGLVKELLTFLQLSDIQFKQDVVIKICWLTEKFGPDVKWKIDSFLETIFVAGDIVPEEVTWNFIILIQQNLDLQNYAVHKLFDALKKDVSKPALNRVGIWAIGEYGDLLALPDGDSPAVQPHSMVDLIEQVEVSGFCDNIIKGEILVALTKLSTRIPPENNTKILKIINAYKTNMDIELQQRAVEFTQFFSNEQLRLEAMNRMPIPVDLHQETHSKDTNQDTSRFDDIVNVGLEEDQPIEKEEQQPTKQNDDLLDLLGIGSAPTQHKKESTDSLLDLLSTPMNTTTTTFSDTPLTQLSSQPIVEPQTLHEDIISQPEPIISQQEQTIVSALSADGVVINFHVTQTAETYKILAKFSNSNPFDLTQFSMKVAVPKWIELQLMNPSSTVIPLSSIDKVTQELVLTKTVTDKPVVVKIKVTYNKNGDNHEENANVFVSN
ncbi:AP-1 complex subunit gamma [Entamoeba marina]